MFPLQLLYLLLPYNDFCLYFTFIFIVFYTYCIALFKLMKGIANVQQFYSVEYF